MEPVYLEGHMSKGALQPMEFYPYHLIAENPSQEVEILKLARSAARRLNNSYNEKYFAATNDENLYTLRPVPREYLSFDILYNGKKFTMHLQPEDKKILPFDTALGKRIYQDVIPLIIYDQLGKISYNGRPKYRILNNRAVQTPWILQTDGSFREIASRGRSLRLYREFHLQAEILKDGHCILYLENYASFESAETVYRLAAANPQSKKMLEGRRARYILPISFNQVGKIGVVRPDAKDPFSCREGLLDYFRRRYPHNKKVQWALAHSPQDDFPLQLQKKDGSRCNYLASTLKLVFDTETVKQWDPGFLRQNFPLIRPVMSQRIAADRALLEDVGHLDLLQQLSFQHTPVSGQQAGFQSEIFPAVYLTGGHEVNFKAGFSEKKAVFNPAVGFYRQPECKQIHMGFISLTPKVNQKQMTYIANFLLLQENLRTLMPDAEINAFPAQILFQNETELKEKIYELKEIKKPYFCFVVVDDMDRWHDTVKEFFIQSRYGGIHTHTQLMDVQSAYLLAAKDYFLYKSKDGQAVENARLEEKITAKYKQQLKGLKLDQAEQYAPALVMGAFAKMGGIPFRFRENLGGDDTLFVGLDVATERKGVHYPSCSVVYNGHGEYVGGCQPRKSQPGEIISVDNLQKIFDDVLLPYKRKYGTYPSHMIIHRDGRTRKEELGWYVQYCRSHGIALDVVDVVKSDVPRLCRSLGKGEAAVCASYANPQIGTCLYRGSQAVLVSTAPYCGAPRPLKLEHVYGKKSIREITYEVYCLTKLSCSSLHNRRLPVTTGDADKMCKAGEYLIQDEFFSTLDYL